MIWALAGGYLIGSLPTADALARLSGIRLREQGTGNPGAANALRLGGARLAVAVLAVDVVKGVGAVVLGRAVDGDATGLAAAIAVILGQVLNVWYGFSGGKGLGVAAGAGLALWPPGLLAVAPVFALAARLFRAAVGALIGLAVLFGLAMLWAEMGWSTWWGVSPDDTVVWFAIWVLAITSPKFVADLADG